MWKTFIEALGHEVVISPPTNQDILNNGVKACVDDACLPVKVFFGHIIYLKERVDRVLVPRLMSISTREFICPKFCGLPEMVYYGMNRNVSMLVLNIDLHRKNSKMVDAYVQLGEKLSNNYENINIAYKKATQTQSVFDEQIQNGIFPFTAIEGAYPRKSEIARNQQKRTIGVIGHPYLLYDRFLNMDILWKLQKRNITYLTPERIPQEKVEKEAATLPKRMFWSLGKHLYGSALTMARDHLVDGMIYLSAFGCGIDSLMGDITERHIRRNSDIPFTSITLDEHTGEAGVNTRLDAFIDMMNWRNQNENHISTHGKCLYTY